MTCLSCRTKYVPAINWITLSSLGHSLHHELNITHLAFYLFFGEKKKLIIRYFWGESNGHQEIHNYLIT